MIDDHPSFVDQMVTLRVTHVGWCQHEVTAFPEGARQRCAEKDPNGVPSLYSPVRGLPPSAWADVVRSDFRPQGVPNQTLKVAYAIIRDVDEGVPLVGYHHDGG